jgi:hypothetical protein
LGDTCHLSPPNAKLVVRREVGVDIAAKLVWHIQQEARHVIHDSPGAINNLIGFGTVRGARDRRIMQLAMRFVS